MSTAQNASFSADLVQAQKVLVITDTTHVARCERLFRRHFRSVRAVGVPLARQSRVRMAFREAFIEAWSP